MKRRASPSTSGPDQPDQNPRRRRQPQISCNFCRSKKLKCDRGQPCSNCTNRGMPCDGQPATVLASGSGTGSVPASPQVLERLRRLEEAVFGSHHDAHLDAHLDTHRSTPIQDETPASSSGRPLGGHREPSAEVEYNNTVESLALDDCCTFHFRVTSRSEYASPSPRTGSASIRCIDVPTREDAQILFQDYVDNSYFQIANVLHLPYIQSTIDQVYQQLRQGHKVDLGSAALILSFCAASAFFWDQGFPTKFNFPSNDDDDDNAAAAAAAQCHLWRGAAWDLLDQAQRSACHSLDAIQGRMILADLLHNLEGITSRFRQLHSCARTSAYELRLHLVDLPGHHHHLTDNPFLREIKRRIWWHLVATDWLLSSMGGAMDRIYTVHPQQMHVNRPSLIPDSDPPHAASDPSSHNLLVSETAVQQMNIRIRIAEISREIVDALPLGSGDLDTLPYSKIASLDKKYETILAQLQPTAAATVNTTTTTTTTGSTSPLDAHRATRKIALERSIAVLSVSARRAKLLRPLLQIKDMPQRFEVFRKQCLHSTQTVIEIASTVLSETVDTPPNQSARGNRGGGSRYHSGLIIMHLFMACAVLATDPSLRGGAEERLPPGGAAGGIGMGMGMDPETEQRRTQLANACRLLEKAGEKSPMALDMVKRLVGVLRKHRVHGVEQQHHQHHQQNQQKHTKTTTVLPPPNPGSSYPAAAAAAAAAAAVVVVPTVSVSAVSGRVHPLGGQNQMQEHQMQTYSAAMDPAGGPGGFPAPAAAPPHPQNWTYDVMDPNGLTGIWHDFLGTNPTDFGWEQLFSELDYMGGNM